MSVREYIGARYIPLFADPIEWDDSYIYEPLTVVKHEGASYVSRKSVPEGIAIDNTDYWILWADYNAQLQHYIDEVNTFDNRIDSIEDALPIADFDSVDTVKAKLDAIEEALPIADFDSVNTVKAKLDAIEEALPIESYSSSNTIKDEFDSIKANSWVTTNRIADEAVTNGKIADETITGAKIADETITSAKIADEAITADKMGSFYEDDIEDLQEQINTIRNKDIDERIYFYVDSVNGDDTNDGLTSATAFKTFRRAMQIREEGYTDINLRFMPGEYYNYDWRWTNVSCHIIPHPDAILHMAPNNLFNVYNCYIHFERMSDTGVNTKPKITFENGIHTDASSLFCQNCEFIGGSTDSGAPKRIDCYMSSSTFIDCTYNHINFLLRNGVYSISGGEITNNTSITSRILSQNALLGIYNLKDTTSILSQAPENDAGYVDLQYCHAALYFDNNMAMPTTIKYPYFLRSRFSTVEMTNASYQRVIANSSNASGVTGHSTLVHAKTSIDIVT